MINFVKKLYQDLGPRITGGAAGSFGLNILNQIILLGITMILTRIMAPDSYGLYAVIVSTMLLLALPFSGGFPLFIIRHLSAYKAKDRYDLCRGLIQRTFVWIAGGGIVIAAILYFIFPTILDVNSYYFRAGLGLMVLPPLLLFSGSILRGFRYVLWGRFPEFFIQPFIFLCVLFSLLFAGTQNVNVINILDFHIGSYAIALTVALIILFFLLPRDVKQAKAVYETPKWIKSALPLMLAVGLVVFNSNIDIIMVGALADETQAGQYRVASRMAGFVLFFLFAANNTMGALISAKHTKGEHTELQKLLTAIARATMLGTLPIALILWIWSDQVLSLLFGKPFAAGAFALVILVSANFFSVFMGQVGHVISMAGQEKYTAYAALCAALINILLNYILIPLYGMNGAAIATASSIVIWNAILAVWTVQKTGYHCTILGVLKK